MKRITIFLAVLLTLVLTACGGGGSSSSGSGGSGGGGGGGTTSTAMGCGTVTDIGSGNTSTVFIDGFPCAAGGGAGQVNWSNVPYVAVKICAPGSTSNCQIIDHVILDTGSTGVRIAASALSSALQPGVTGGLPLMAGQTASSKLTQCETYVASYVYGPLASADVYIAGKKVANTPVQVFGANGYTAPPLCSGQSGTATNTPQTFGGNGLIGVSFDPVDNYSYYFDCSSTSCVENTAYTGTPNLVTLFSGDNNGVTIKLPAISSSGSSSVVTGSLLFGVGTQANNTPTSAYSVTNDNYYGTFNVSVKGTSWTSAYIDSGTDAVYFDDSGNAALKVCTATSYTGYYCPTSPQAYNFAMASTNSTVTAGSLKYSVGSATSLYTNANIATANVAGPQSSSTTTTNTTVAFGLSSHFGHNMYVVFTNATAPAAGFNGASSGTIPGPLNGIE